MSVLAVALGGALGAVARAVVDAAVSARTGRFPWGTWTVNVLGALILGVLSGWLGGRDGAPLWHVAAASGFCGAFTTFSTWMHQTLALLERRWWRLAAWNIASLAIGVAAAAAGWALGAALAG